MDCDYCDCCECELLPFKLRKFGILHWSVAGCVIDGTDGGGTWVAVVCVFVVRV
jgi:hypothetical protein